MELIAKCWNVDHWVKFKLMIGEYENLIAFFDAHELSFLSKMELNMVNMPVSLRGRGNSKNLLEYISNNVDNPDLIFRFVSYFLNGIIDARYNSGKKLIFHFNYNDRWQEQSLQVSGPNVPPTTALPTTTVLPTTTELLVGFQEPIV